MKSLSENQLIIIQSVFYRFLNTFSSVFLLTILNSTFGSQKAGFFAIIFAGIAWVGLLEFGIPNVFVNLISRIGLEEAIPYLRRSYLLLFFISTISLAIGTVLFFAGINDYSIILICLAIRLPFVSASRIFLAIGEIHRYYFINAVFSIIAGVLMFFILSIFDNQTIAILAYVLMVSMADLYLSIKNPHIRRAMNIFGLVEKLDSHEAFGFWRNQVIGLCLYQSLPFVILHYVNTQQAGEYAYISRFYIAFSAMHSIIFQGVWPKVAKISITERAKKLPSILFKNLTITLILYGIFNVGIFILYNLNLAKHSLNFGEIGDIYLVSFLYMIIIIMQLIALMLNGLDLQKEQSFSGMLSLLVIILVFSIFRPSKLEDILMIFAGSYTAALILIVFLVAKFFTRGRNA